MLQELLEEERRYLNRFFDALDLKEAEKICDKLLHCKGMIFLSGVGKSGHIAQKIATTFVSTGTKAMFLSPAHALHGDIGIVAPGDLFLALSKSGESQELLDLLPHIQRKEAFTIALVSEPNSRLANVSHLSMILPVEKELCPFDLAPTTSTAVQLIFGDCLAIALMRAKGLTVDDFAMNHPGGFLGRKIALKVADLMLKGEALPLGRLQDKLIDVLHELSAKRCGCLLVADDQRRLKGIFTDGDLRRAIQTKGADALQNSLSELMVQVPRTTHAGCLAIEAMRQMEADPQRPITVLPVIENEQIVGLLRMHDILQAGLH